MFFFGMLILYTLVIFWGLMAIFSIIFWCEKKHHFDLSSKRKVRILKTSICPSTGRTLPEGSEWFFVMEGTYLFSKVCYISEFPIIEKDETEQELIIIPSPYYELIRSE